MFCQVQLTSQRERFLCLGHGKWITLAQMPSERKICRCLVRYGTETIPSQMRVCCNRNNLEKRFDKPGSWVVCGMGSAANWQLFLFTKISSVGYQHWEHVHYWSNFLVSWWHLHWKVFFFFFGRCDGPECFHVDDEDMRSSGGSEVNPKYGNDWFFRSEKGWDVRWRISSWVDRACPWC